MIKSAALLGFALLSTPAMAQASLIGPSQKSCGSWVHERHDQSTLSVAYSAWIFGYVSGLNAASVISVKTPDFLKGIDADAILGWMDSYCDSHPLENLGNATVQLYVDLSKKAH